jgi:biotin synthase
MQVVDGIVSAVRMDKVKRVCIQALNYPSVFDDVLRLISSIRSRCAVPVSISCQPVNISTMKRLAEAGAERIGIPLDTVTEEIFNKMKGKQAGGPYVWQRQLKVLEDAVKVFGKEMVSTHLIVGLGETEEDLAKMFQFCVDMGVYPALFAFTPVSGTALESSLPPSLGVYRRVQLTRYLITLRKVRYENLRFDDHWRIINFGVSRKALNKIVESGAPFLTSGCPDCNRPYYNEKPGGSIFNFPQMPTLEEIREIEKAFRE